MTTNSNDRFIRMMSILFAVAGVIWLMVALYNVRQGRSFSWTGLGIFILLLAAFGVARGRGRRSR